MASTEFLGYETEHEDVTKEKLMADLRLVISDAEELIKATASQTGEKITEARTRAESTLRAAKGRLAEAQAAVIGKAKAAAKATDDYVHENPWKAVGIAAGVGFILGILVSRR